MIAEAKAAGLDVRGLRALPDGSVVVDCGDSAPGTLFDQLERDGKL